MGNYDEPTQAIIFDIDGTLSDCEHRRHHVEGKKKDFDAFYSEMDNDHLRPEIRTLCNIFYMNSWHIILCTGRPESYREITEKWLKSYGVFYHELIMRPIERRTDPDFEVKQDMLNEILKTRKVYFAVDDRNQVVDMWRRNGITCFQCADGDF
jgi:hypothetical protein